MPLCQSTDSPRCTSYLIIKHVISFLALAVTIATMHMDGQAVLVWVAWLNTNMVYPRNNNNFKENIEHRESRLQPV